MSAVAVLNATDGRVIARWDAGLHPNELLLSSDGRHLFVSNGGRNTVTVIETETGTGDRDPLVVIDAGRLRPVRLPTASRWRPTVTRCSWPMPATTTSRCSM